MKKNNALFIYLISGLRPGALIGTVRANDIDTFPPISYRIISNDVTDKTGGDDATNVTEVAVDTFTGQIYLLQKPSDWKSNPLVITISASDQVNVVHSHKMLAQLEVYVFIFTTKQLLNFTIFCQFTDLLGGETN